jgi:hypothetical protein
MPTRSGSRTWVSIVSRRRGYLSTLSCSRAGLPSGMRYSRVLRMTEIDTCPPSRGGARMAGHGTARAPEPIVYIDHSDIREGSLEELKAGVERLVDFIAAREPQRITYGFYIDEEAAKMTVVAGPSRFGVAGAPHGHRQRGIPQAGAPAYAHSDRMLRPAERKGT